LSRRKRPARSGGCGKHSVASLPSPFNPHGRQTLRSGWTFFRAHAISAEPPLWTLHIMLDSLRNFVSELTGGQKHPGRFEENDYRLAAAALMIHACTIDGSMSEAERDKLRAVLKSRFALDNAATEELIDVSTLAENESVDLYHFTTLINRTLDEAGRLGVVEMMWEIVFADGRVNEFEDNLMWRAADLLGVSSRDRIAIRRRVAGEKAESDGA
jgi:uncharacterized tellurite resistance protein B-like protein